MSRQPSTAIIRELDRIQSVGFRPGTIFEDWVALTLVSLRMLPQHIASITETGHYADDDAETRETFQKIRDRYDRGPEVQPNVFTHFARAMALLLDASHDGDQPTYLDIVGTIYEEWGIANAAAGQFFTPQPLCEMMAELLVENIEREVHKRLREALRSTREYRMAELFGVTPSDDALRSILELQTEPITGFDRLTAYDPCVGSGRMLLAVAKKVPAWMIHRGLVGFYGQDKDGLCVQMAMINLSLYGMDGRAVYLTMKEREELPAETLPVVGQQLQLF